MNALVKIAEAEILPPVDEVCVIIAPNPLQPHKRSTLAYAPGGTIGEILAAALKETNSEQKASDFTVMIGRGFDDMSSVPMRLWRLVKPKAGTTLVMRAVPEFSAIFGAVTAISSAIASLGFFGKLLMGVIAFGAKLLLNKLFAPKQPKPTPSDAKPAYSITGSRNTVNQYGKLPVALGRHRWTPPLGALPYTESVGREQFLRMIFVVGYGRLAISEIKIGETLIGNFEDVTVETREGVSLSEATTLYPTNRQPIEEQLGITLTIADSWQRRTTAENVNYIAVDVVWPQGLAWFGDAGQRYPMGGGFRWRSRLVGTVPWTEHTQFFWAQATEDILRATRTVAVASGQYEVEVLKLGTTDDFGSTTVRHELQWVALRGYRTGEPIAFTEPVAVIAVKIRATGQLNGVIDTLNCIAQSKVKAWNGSSWVANTVSRNPADLMRHVLQGPFNPEPYADDEIDLPALQSWHSYCSSNGWTYDKVIIDPVSVWDVVTEICAAGRAMPVFKDGLYSVTWDEQASLPVQMFTPRNSWGFEAVKSLNDVPHAYRCLFINAAKGFRQDERLVFDDGYGQANATIIEQFEMPGVTSTNLIWKHARFQIAQLRLRPEQFSLNVALEGIIPTRNDRVRVQHDVPLIGLGSGRVMAVDATPGAQSVSVDEVLTMSPDDLYNLRFRLRDGTWLVRNVAPGTTGELRIIPLQGDDDMPEVDDLFAFGPLEQETRTYRVLAIEPQESETFRITLVDDAPEIYLADTGEIPDYDGGITEPVDPFELPPQKIRISDGAYEEDGQFFAFLNVSWEWPRLGRAQSFQVEWRDESNGFWNQFPGVTPDTTGVSIRRLNPGLYTVRVRAIFGDGTFSKWNTSEVYNANAINQPPGNVETFRIATSGDITTLSWSPVIGAAVTYEIRFCPASVVSPTWNTATPVLEGMSGTSAQVQSRIGTWLIKAKVPSGMTSVVATTVSSNLLALTGFNAVEVIAEHPSFAGERENVSLKDGELRLRYRDRISDWTRLSDIQYLTIGAGLSPGIATEGYYYFASAIDLGLVHTPVRMTAEIEARGSDPYNKVKLWARLSSVQRIGSVDPADWGVELQYRSTVVNPIDDDWTDWQTFTVGDVTARAFEFRLKLTARPADTPEDPYAVTTPVVSKASVTIDMPDRVIAGDDLPVSGAGLTVSFDPPFRELQGLGIAAQDMATGDRFAITAKSENGFHIQFLNSGGTPVARTFDYVAKGYGAVIT